MKFKSSRKHATSPGKYLPFTKAMSTGDQIDKFLSSVQIKRLFNEGKLLSCEERSLQEVCSLYSVDKTTSKSYVQHPEFLNAISNISRSKAPYH